MRQVCLAILRLYPAEHRSIFAQEMMETFEQAALDWRKRGLAAFLYFAVWELTGLVSGLYTEWIAKCTAPAGYLASQTRVWPASNVPAEVAHAQKRVQHLIGCMEFAIAHHDFPKARLYSDQERVAREQLHRLLSDYKLDEQRS